MSSKATGMTMKTSAPCAARMLEKEITYPEFYHDLADFDKLEIT